MSEVIKEIQDLANECGEVFDIIDEYYEDKTIKVYTCKYTRFLDVNNCLLYMRHHIEKWRIEQQVNSYALQVHEYTGKLKEAKKQSDQQHKEIIKLKEQRRERADRIEEYRVESCRLLADIAQERIFVAQEKKKVRSLRSQLGHAKRRAKK